ncbi:MAG: hypothetical protein QOK00_1081 [Thermoleophilaceae bacterium]|jgi:hypothetical protein|nr:hypothetical protein [Thermoleophilaceae bacterium]MEA2400678.1 hypothetical protein [Thermoleophilaceae bacterium]
MDTMTFVAQATGDEPAGGAAIGEALGATAAAVVATALIALLIAGHRSGRIDWLGRASRFAERATGLPAWAALPSMLLSASLLTAVTGMYWDISLHIDNGRDEGPLANPAHYLILIGLYGVLLAGVLTAAFARERPSRTAVALGGGWWMPVGGVLIAACGAFALTGFPLDDVWHRLFGQDVTLWGPTHLMLIGGGSLATLGAMALLAEAIGNLGRDPERQRPRLLLVLRRGLLAGSFLVALSTFQGEFDFGVPQFRQVLHPILVMMAAGIGLVTARVYLGRGGALQAVLGFVVIRGFLALMVGGVWDQTTPHFPLYIVEALAVEAVFARSRARSPVATGALAGAMIGTVGLAAEWGWSHVWMPIPWTESLLPEAAIAGFVTAVAAGAVGGFVGGALARPVAGASGIGPARLRLGPRAHRAALAGFLVLVAVIGWGLPISSDGPERATVSLTEARPGPERAVDATIRFSPADSADGAHFANVTAWQGGGSVVSELEEVRPGVYRTTEPIPVHGGWKALIRVHTGDSLVGVPIYLPRDRAIPAPEVPATASFERPFVRDLALLQRERKEGVAGGLTLGAYVTVAAIAAALIALIAWALLRLEGVERAPRDPRAARRTSAVEPELV